MQDKGEVGATKLTVRGRVIDGDGRPVSCFVHLWDQDLRTRQQLNAKEGTLTDEVGRFAISYTSDQFARAEKGSADLVFTLTRRRGRAAPLGTFQLVRLAEKEKHIIDKPQILFQAGTEEEVELILGEKMFTGPSEYEELVEALTPVLNGLPLAELTEDNEHQDITFLARETGQDLQRITFLATAHRLALKTNVPPEVFYGLFRQNLPTELPALLAQSPDVQRRALETAVNENIIPARFRGEIDRLLEGFKSLIVRQAFELPPPGKYSFGDLLKTTLPDQNTQEAFLKAYVDHQGPIEEFWKGLRQRPDLKDQVNDLQFTLQLGAITRNHLPLVQQIQQMKEKRSVTRLRDLARMDLDNWKKIINEVGVPPDVPGQEPEQQIDRYARAITRILEDAFPTAAIAYRIEKDDLPGKQNLVKFFARSVFASDAEDGKKFDIATTYVEDYVAKNPDVFDGISAPEKEDLKNQLKAIQRLYKLTPRYSELSVLMKDALKLDSAHKIARLGKQAFTLRYGQQFGAARARAVYERAEQAVATALNLLADLGGPFNQPAIAVLPSASPQAVDGIPDWATLFGPLDLCACEHCKSIYSPAAYLVDVLHFLNDRKLFEITPGADGTSNNGPFQNRSAKDVLFERRPDLGEIELSCENTNTVLPYIDLLNEVLENAVAPLALFVPFTLPTAFTNELDELYLSPGLQAVFESNNAKLTPHATVTVKKKGQWWTITEPAFLYTIRQDGSVLKVVTRGLQTSGTAQELAANPQYQNAKAYEELRKAVHPWDLPFDLWVQEARIYLDHLGVKRHAIMEAFSPQIRLDTLKDVGIVAEYLGLTPLEHDIITGGLRVRLATTVEISTLAGLNPIDGITTTAGNRVLVKDQSDPAQNGIYIVQANAWQRTDAGVASPMYVTVVDGATNKDTGWMLAQALDGNVTITPLPPWMFWGFSDDDVLMPDPTNANATLAAKWFTWLTRVDIFLRQSGLDDGKRADRGYQDLLELLSTRYINPPHIIGGPLEIRPSDSTGSQDSTPETCTLSQLVISFIAPTDAGRQVLFVKIHRFVRLARALGWTYRDLDKAITALDPKHPHGYTDLTPEFLVQLSHVERLRKKLNLPILTVLSWWGPLDTARYVDYKSEGQREVPSLYESLFLNKAVIQPLDEAFELNSTRDELRTPSTSVNPITISGHSAVIVAALGISESDLALLLQEGVVADELTLANLSALYRHASLAKALKLTVRDFLSVLKLTGAHPFDRAQTEGTVFVVEQVDKIRASGFTVEELDYLLRHKVRPAAQIEPADESITLIFDDIDRAHAAIAAENQFIDGQTSDPEGELVRKKLAVLLSPADVDAVMVMLDGTATDAAANNTLIDQHLATFLDPTEAKAKLVGPPPGIALAETEQRFLYVLKPLMAYLARTLSESLVKQKLSEVLKLEIETTEQLLAEWVNSPSDATKKSLTEFLTPTSPDSRKNTYLLLQKIAMVLTRFKTTPRQARWLFEYGPSAGWLNLNSLPIAPPASATAPFSEWSKWETLTDFMRVRTSLPISESQLGAILKQAFLNPPSKPEYLNLVSAWTEWNTEDLQVLAGDFNDTAQKGLLNVEFPNDYKSGQILRRLHDCFAIIKRLGVAAQTCSAWVQGSVTEDVARSIKQAAKAKYDEQQWLALARPLRDVLREKQRVALVSYLVAHPRRDSNNLPLWNDSRDLYAYYLIDVEMSACMLTSRIKQAIGSAQLFVQRCLMNLEKDVLASAAIDASWRWWGWMKSYRVWEANRKIFLYPENWIEPELRDDKSPFFKDLENELLQNDLTQDTAETAFLHYLEKLDQVARLEIVGMYHQLETHDGRPNGNVLVDILHVFGRTRATPHVYYYRRRVNSSYWTAWERVDVDIEGDHLIPVVWNRRLYLFWPIFTEEAEETPVILNPGMEVSPAEKKWKIQLAWSEYKATKWAAKRISAPAFMKGSFYDSDKRFYSFTTRFDVNGDLIIYPRKTTEPKGHYRFVGCNDIPVYLDEPLNAGMQLNLANTGIENMMFVENAGAPSADPLQLASLAVGPQAILLLKVIPTLGSTPGIFRLQTSCQEKVVRQNEGFHIAEPPLFFQDDSRTFFICLHEEETPRLEVDDKFDPVLIDDLEFSQDAPLVSESAQPLENPFDPELFEPSYPVGSSSPPVAGMSSLSGDTASSTAIETGGPGAVGTALALTPGASVRYYSYIGKFTPKKGYLFQTFYHPYICDFVRELNRDGVDGLLQRRVQLQRRDYFEATYNPTAVVLDPSNKRLYPRDEVDFSFEGAYSLYNWELFFHVPLLIADRLTKNQRFEEAHKWFHYIFDPTDTSSEPVPQRYWRTRPFYEKQQEIYQNEQITNLLRRLSEGDPDLANQVRQWRDNPFKPHLVARLRTTAYQKTVVMKYIENLIAWGDQLFRRETIESINEATQLYILAAQILGPRPAHIPPRGTPSVHNYNSLKPLLDAFSNALVQIENLIPSGSGSVLAPGNQPPVTLSEAFYFCVPRNDKLLGYWDTVEDRLFKIRYCMTIEGVVRQLPLFEPPIEPGLLVKAAAAGVDISSVLNDVNAALPHYRFNVMAQKASELCAEVKSLGAALLSALEKRDAEELALLRSTHELKMLYSVRQIKEKQIEEAKKTIEGLKKNEELIQHRLSHYIQLAKESPGESLIPPEKAQLDLMQQGLVIQIVETELELLGQALNLTPTFKVGSPFTIGVEFGGEHVGNANKSIVSYMGSIVSMLNTSASMSANMSGYVRRWEDWIFQKDLAEKELKQIKDQQAAAEVRLAIAEKDLQNHDLQTDNAKQVDDFMHEKFSNQELYNWMVGQVSSLYFQSYQLAYDVAKRAERAYRHELGLQDSSFIQFGYWDSLKKGLLAGDRLSHDLKRMEIAYLDQNKREYEITKHVSLALLDPLALIQLKQTGECFVNLPEALFDLDYPGHYMRRLKSVSLTIPSVSGPYTGVNCTLTLLKSSIRHVSINSDPYARQDIDNRFRDSLGAIQSIVTSSAQNDSGLFETNLRDERYLPFEGAGAISDWHLKLPNEFRQFDYDTISDVVFHLRYTAREGGKALGGAALIEMQAKLNELMKLAEDRGGLFRLFSVRHEFSSQWYKFLHPETGKDQQLTLDLSKAHFPFLYQDKEITITNVELILKRQAGETAINSVNLRLRLVSNSVPLLTTEPGAPGSVAPTEESTLLHVVKAISTNIPQETGSSWVLTAWLDDGSGTPGRIGAEALTDLWVVCSYTVAVSP